MKVMNSCCKNQNTYSSLRYLNLMSVAKINMTRFSLSKWAHDSVDVNVNISVHMQYR